MKVNDENVWSEIKEGKIKGFSVEGLFQLAEVDIEQKYNPEEAEVLELLKEINKRLFKNK